MIINNTSKPPSLSVRTKRQPRSRSPLLFILCWLHLLLVIGLCITLHLTGDRWWVGTLLLLSPRWPIAIPLVALWPWILAARRWDLGIVTAAATTLILMHLMDFRVSFPPGEPARGHLRLLSCNIHRQQIDIDRLARFIQETEPDVIALQDWTSAHHDRLFRAGWHVRAEGELLVASRHPIGEVKVLDLIEAGAPKSERGAAARFELKSPQGPIYLINLHLASPHLGLIEVLRDRGQTLADNAQRRWGQSEAIRALAEEVHAPLLLAGDFNTPPDSPLFRTHWSDFANGFAEQGFGFGFTYMNNHTQLRIDHILADSSLRFMRCWIGPELGSPHRPLVADLHVR